MQKNFWAKRSVLLLFFNCHLAFTAPWYTGPIIAPGGKTIPLGHANFEFYSLYTKNKGQFDAHGKLIHTPATQSIQANPVLTYGLTNRIDAQFSVPYGFDHSFKRSQNHIGDTSALLGFQALEQNETHWWPNLRITLQEIFPTGRLKNLNPTNQQTIQGVPGSYETALGFNFQHLLALGTDHYLRTRFCLNYMYIDSVNVTPPQVHPITWRIKPGNQFSIDLAGELSITQNWVAVMEGYYLERGATRLESHTSSGSQKLRAKLAQGQSEEISIAPAIEYNFSANIGLIAGVWLALKGKNSQDYVSTVVALNAYW